MPEKYIQKNSDFEVKFSTNVPGHTEKEHFHPEGKEICIVIEGELKMKIDGKESILKEGDFLYSEGGICEEVLETIKPYKIITVRVPSIPSNKKYIK
ncbi:MAG: cupin domain-containing protein [Candidatus Moraniibacteriota bacterium]